MNKSLNSGISFIVILKIVAIVLCLLLLFSYGGDKKNQSSINTDGNGYVTYTRGNEVVLIGYKGNDADLILPDNVTRIDSNAFYKNNEITSVVIPSSVASIGSNAFYGCSLLTSVVIGDNVKTVGASAFEECVALESVTLGKNVTEIKENAFNSCEKLAEVYNKSSLNIVAGSEENGGIGRYAENIYVEENSSGNSSSSSSSSSTGGSTGTSEPSNSGASSNSSSTESGSSSGNNSTGSNNPSTEGSSSSSSSNTGNSQGSGGSSSSSSSSSSEEVKYGFEYTVSPPTEFNYVTVTMQNEKGQDITLAKEGDVVNITVTTDSGVWHSLAFVSVNGITYFDKTNEFNNYTCEFVCEGIVMPEGGLEIIIKIVAMG